MRPKSIRTFERLYLASVAASVIVALASFVLTQSTFDTASPIEGVDDPMLGTIFTATLILMGVFTLLFALIIPLVLWQLAAHRGSNVARWFIVALAVLSVLRMAGFLLWLSVSPEVFGGGEPANLSIWVGFFLYETLHFASIPFLFRADAAAWFRTRGTRVEADVFS